MRSDLIAEIHVDALIHNYRQLRSLCGPGVAFCAPLKANAYGHGVNIVAPALQAAGADCAGVATLEEALELRAIGWKRPILVFGNVLAVADAAERRERIEAACEHDLTLTIVDEASVQRLARAEPRQRIAVHVKLDSGMGRMGALPSEAAALIRLVRSTRCLRLAGIYSHLATADLADRAFAERQLAAFKLVLAECAPVLPAKVIRHLAKSAATLTWPAAHLDMVRPGLALYGYAPLEEMPHGISLRPILRVVSHLTAVKSLPPGHSVGYGRTFTTTRPTRLGIVPAGYADGFLRGLSNAAVVGTSHGDAPVVGRVSMDQLAVDLTDLPPMQPGDSVVLIDDRPERPNSVAALARLLGTIPYEVTCLLGSRARRTAVASYQPAPAAARARN